MMNLLFQFQTGSIKSQSKLCQNRVNSFQFQTGSIKRKKPVV